MAYFFQNLQNDNFSLNLGDNVALTSPMGYANHTIDNNAVALFSSMNNYNSVFRMPNEIVNSYAMFYGCPNFNSPITIDPYNSQLTSMGLMFSECPNFSQDINVPVNCHDISRMVNTPRWNSNTSQMEITYKNNIHIYSNYNGYSEGNFAYAFAYSYSFSGNIYFHSNITDIYSLCYYDNSFNAIVDLPEGVLNTSYAFGYCNMYNQNIKIPSTVNQASYMFASCYNLNQNILLPPSDIDVRGCFSWCTNLNQNIRIPSNSQISDMFYYCNSLNYPMYVPNYYSDWGRSESSYGPIYSINQCDGNSIFESCHNLNSIITFNDDITVLSQTFASCSNLNVSPVMPSSLKIAHRTFTSCYNLNTLISFPEGTKALLQTFTSCSNLNQNIQIPSTVEYMNGTFSSCSNLNQNILIPNGCVNVNGVFSRCHALNMPIAIPTSVRYAGSLFGHCENFNQPVNLHEGLVNIWCMYERCWNLYQSLVNIPTTVVDFYEAFCDTRVINVNIRSASLAGNSWVYYNNLITLYSHVNTAGATPSEYNPYGGWTPSTIEDYDNAAKWGTAIGYMNINNNLNSLLYSNLVNLVGGQGYNNYNQYANTIESISNEYTPYSPEWERAIAQANHGGVVSTYMAQVSHSEIIRKFKVLYADYPNATSAQDTNYYLYDIQFI